MLPLHQLSHLMNFLESLLRLPLRLCSQHCFLLIQQIVVLHQHLKFLMNLMIHQCFLFHQNLLCCLIINLRRHFVHAPLESGHLHHHQYLTCQVLRDHLMLSNHSQIPNLHDYHHRNLLSFHHQMKH